MHPRVTRPSPRNMAPKSKPHWLMKTALSTQWLTSTGEKATLLSLVTSIVALVSSQKKPCKCSYKVHNHACIRLIAKVYNHAYTTHCKGSYKVHNHVYSSLQTFTQGSSPCLPLIAKVHNHARAHCKGSHNFHTHSYGSLQTWKVYNYAYVP